MFGVKIISTSCQEKFVRVSNQIFSGQITAFSQISNKKKGEPEGRPFQIIINLLEARS